MAQKQKNTTAAPWQVTGEHFERGWHLALQFAVSDRAPLAGLVEEIGLAAVRTAIEAESAGDPTVVRYAEVMHERDRLLSQRTEASTEIHRLGLQRRQAEASPAAGVEDKLVALDAELAVASARKADVDARLQSLAGVIVQARKDAAAAIRRITSDAMTEATQELDRREQEAKVALAELGAEPLTAMAAVAMAREQLRQPASGIASRAIRDALGEESVAV